MESLMPSSNNDEKLKTSILLSLPPEILRHILYFVALSNGFVSVSSILYLAKLPFFNRVLHHFRFPRIRFAHGIDGQGSTNYLLTKICSRFERMDLITHVSVKNCTFFQAEDAILLLKQLPGLEQLIMDDTPNMSPIALLKSLNQFSLPSTNELLALRILSLNRSGLNLLQDFDEYWSGSSIESREKLLTLLRLIHDSIHGRLISTTRRLIVLPLPCTRCPVGLWSSHTPPKCDACGRKGEMICNTCESKSMTNWDFCWHCSDGLCRTYVCDSCFHQIKAYSLSLDSCQNSHSSPFGVSICGNCDRIMCRSCHLRRHYLSCLSC